MLLRLGSRHWRSKQSIKTQAKEASTCLKVLWATEKIYHLPNAVSGCVQGQPCCLQDPWLSERREWSRAAGGGGVCGWPGKRTMEEMKDERCCNVKWMIWRDIGSIPPVLKKRRAHWWLVIIMISRPRSLSQKGSSASREERKWNDWSFSRERKGALWDIFPSR